MEKNKIHIKNKILGSKKFKNIKALKFQNWLQNLSM